MGKRPAFQFYPKQYVADNKVQAMDWDARGMYVHLLCMAWQEDPPGTLPADDAVIRRWLNLASDTEDNLRVWRRVRPQILAAFSCRDTRLVNSGMVECAKRAENYRERYEKSVKNARDPLKKKTEDSSCIKSTSYVKKPPYPPLENELEPGKLAEQVAGQWRPNGRYAERRPSAQVERWNNNNLEIERHRREMAQIAQTASNGQTARSGARNPALLDTKAR